MAKKRVPAETQKLAYWFVNTFLGKKFDYTFDRRYLKDAKNLVNPDREDAVPLDPEKVKGCLLALKAGMFGFDGELNSMYPITYANEDCSYYEQYLKWIEIPPPFYRP